MPGTGHSGGPSHRWRWALTAAPGLNPTARLILCSLAYHATPEGYCFPSLKALAGPLGLSVRTVDRAMRVLRAGGLVEIAKLPGLVGRHNAYRLTGVLTDWSLTPIASQPEYTHVEHDTDGVFEYATADVFGTQGSGEMEGQTERQSNGLIPSIYQSLLREHDAPDVNQTTNVVFDEADDDELVSRIVREHWVAVRAIRPWRSIRAAIRAYSRHPNQFADLLADLHLGPDGMPDDKQDAPAQHSPLEPVDRDGWDQSDEAALLWSRALESLYAMLPGPTYETFFQDSRGVGHREGELLIEAPSPFIAEYLLKRMLAVIERVVGEECGEATRVWVVSCE